MRQTVTLGFIPSQRRWFWCVSATIYPHKPLFSSCRHAARFAASRAEREGGEVVVHASGGEVRRKMFEKFDGDNGLRVVGADLI